MLCDVLLIGYMTQLLCHGALVCSGWHGDGTWLRLAWQRYLVGDEGGDTAVEVVQLVRPHHRKVVLVGKHVYDVGQPAVGNIQQSLSKYRMLQQTQGYFTLHQKKS